MIFHLFFSVHSEEDPARCGRGSRQSFVNAPSSLPHPHGGQGSSYPAHMHVYPPTSVAAIDAGGGPPPSAGSAYTYHSLPSDGGRASFGEAAGGYSRGHALNALAYGFNTEDEEDFEVNEREPLHGVSGTEGGVGGPNCGGEGKVHFSSEKDDISLYGTPKEEMAPPGASGCSSRAISVSSESAKPGWVRNQLQNIFQPTDNKLAMKLFGSKKALIQERVRQKAAGHWIIHPCSSFR